MCVFDDSGLASQETYARIMNVLSAFELPIHLFGGYVILNHTPPKMTSVKWSMFVLHFWSSFLDFGLTFLLIPYTIFPLPAGIPLGIMSRFAVPPAVQAFFLVICGALTGMSILAFFENRYNSMKYGPYSQSLTTRVKRYLYLATNYTIAFIYMIPVYHQLPSSEEALNHTLQVIPCLPAEVWENPMYFVFTTSNWIIFASIGGMTLYVCLQILFFVIYSTIALRKRTRKLSRVTSRLQKRFFIALHVQVAIPMFVYLFPVFYVFSTWTFDILNQSLNNLVFICIALHGLLSTLVMLAVHKPYRMALKVLLPKCERFRKRSKVASVRELHLSSIL